MLHVDRNIDVEFNVTGILCYVMFYVILCRLLYTLFRTKKINV